MKKGSKYRKICPVDLKTGIHSLCLCCCNSPDDSCASWETRTPSASQNSAVIRPCFQRMVGVKYG